jgi:single-stranded DNA-binding protein
VSITALVTGRLVAQPEQRIAASGKPFALAKIGTTTDDGDTLVSVIAFGGVAEQLVALEKGDTVSISGRAKVVTWTARDGAAKAGISLTAEVLLTPYHLRRKRQAMRAGDQADTPDEAPMYPHRT